MTDHRPPALPATHQGEPATWGSWERASAGTAAACGRPRRTNPCTECGADARWYVAGTVGRPAYSRAHGNYCGACGHLRLTCVRPPAAGSCKPTVETVEPAPAEP